MRAAKVFREVGFEVQQAQLYEDSESGKWREIDLVVISPDRMGVTRITFAVECKSSSKPWILFSSNVGCAGMSIFWTYSLMSESARKVLSDRSWNDPDNGEDPISIAMFDRLRWLKKRQDTAYSFRQAFSETDAAYTSLVSSMKAASHLVRPEKPDTFPHFRFAFPIVVVDSPLLLCSLSATNEVELTQIQSGEILFTNPDNQKDVACVRVLTTEGLTNFASEAWSETQQLRKELRHAEAVLWEQKFGTQMRGQTNG
jgi:hypothetical protein